MFAQTGLGIEERWIHTVFLLAIRFGTFALVAPPLNSIQIPTLVRVIFIGALSVMLAVSLPFARLPAALPLPALLSAACMEFAIGFSMALGVALAFAAFTTGAQLLDLQVGFSLGQVLDPLTRQRLPVLTSALNQLAIIGFFSTNSHLALIRGFALSLEHFPAGHGFNIGAAVPVLIKQGTALFSLGFAMVAPVIVCLFLAELGLGVLARNLPQMNMFAVGIPLKVLVGVLALSAWLMSAAPVVSRAYASIFSAWEALLLP